MRVKTEISLANREWFTSELASSHNYWEIHFLARVFWTENAATAVNESDGMLYLFASARQLFHSILACENINLSLTCASNRNKNRSKKKTTRPQNKHFTQPWLCMSRGCSPKKRKNEPKRAASLRHCLPSKHTSHVLLSSAKKRERWQSNNDNVRIFSFRVASDAINY